MFGFKRKVYLVLEWEDPETCRLFAVATSERKAKKLKEKGDSLHEFTNYKIIEVEADREWNEPLSYFVPSARQLQYDRD